jgi:hypothetical protein
MHRLAGSKMTPVDGNAFAAGFAVVFIATFVVLVPLVGLQILKTLFSDRGEGR